MKQKLGLACALLGAPRLLLLDEPSVGVDPLSRRELWRMVSELVSGGVTVLWSTAYLEEAERCAYIWLLDAGRLLYDGPPQELSARVRGRVFRRRVAPGEARRTAEEELAREAVLDAVIQGASVRVVAKPGSTNVFQGSRYQPRAAAARGRVRRASRRRPQGREPAGARLAGRRRQRARLPEVRGQTRCWCTPRRSPGALATSWPQTASASM